MPRVAARLEVLLIASAVSSLVLVGGRELLLVLLCEARISEQRPAGFLSERQGGRCWMTPLDEESDGLEKVRSSFRGVRGPKID